MISEIDKKLQRDLPESLYRGIKIVYRGMKQTVRPFYLLYYQIKVKRVQSRHRKAREIVRKKEKINAVFLLIHHSVWKFENLYWLMEQDDHFDPLIVVCPYLTYGEAQMFEELENVYTTFSRKGYRVITTLREDGSWLDVKREIQPDLLFFTSPYPLTRPEYCITNFRDTLTFYVPYVFAITDRPWLRYRQDLHFLVYTIFQESSFQHKMAVKHSLNRGSNSVVTGYPGIDFAFNGSGSAALNGSGQRQINDPWKKTGKPLKRIIWAPHHTIETEKDPFNYSNFLAYADFFLDLAHRYENEIIFSLKPHPLLKPKLRQLPEWGVDRTEQYFSEWDSRPNCQLNEGGYIDLFITSDAMIHDSVSFLVEYICTGKPSLYMVIDDRVLAGYSELGREIIDAHYQSRTKEAVIAYIENVVIGGEDTMFPKREKLIRSYLQPPNGVSASENIMNEVRRIVER